MKYLFLVFLLFANVAQANTEISTAGTKLGIGTTSQNNTLAILGNVGIGTINGDPYLIFAGPSGGAVVSGNVGLGTWIPAQKLDVTGKIKTSGGVIKRVVSVADATSITPNADTSDIVSQTNTQAAGTLTLNAPTGTPADGQPLVLRVISTNSQTNAWNAIYVGNLPGSTSAGTNYYAFIYYSTGVVWQYTGGAGI